MKTHLLTVVSLASAGVLFVAGCNPATPPTQSVQPAPTAVPPPSGPPVSINAEMVSVVDHAAHALWDIEKEGRKPKTQDDWEDVAEHATQLAAAGALIRLPGTGPNDAVLTQQAKWQKWCADLSDAGMSALKASQAMNVDALIAANGKLVDVCEGCHKDFKPSLPSEGIAHKHMHTGLKS